MSIERSVYTILGYDISEYRSRILTDDFRWSDTCEEITNGETRLFTGSGCREDDFLYFGCPLFKSEEYGENPPNALDVSLIASARTMVDRKWHKWHDVFCEIDHDKLPFQIICFEEYS